jgi:hypothetical protein
MAAFTLFDRLTLQRSEETLQRPTVPSRKTRLAIEKIYHQMETILNANAIVNESDAYAAFINRLNPEIELLSEEFHRIRQSIGYAQPEQIRPQLYTGKPITPVPRIFASTPHWGRRELELGKDFNLSFDRNVTPGMANCRIRGKGAWKGRKTITFAIIAP